MSSEKKITADSFKIRCSAINKIMAGQLTGMTPANWREFEKLKETMKKNEEKGKTPLLTENQQKKYNEYLIKEKVKPELPIGAKTYVRQWVKENIIYKRRKLFGNKYTKKGNDNEDAGIELVAEYFDLGFLTNANDDGRVYGEFIEGICDVKLQNFLIDIKNSYTFDTFPIFETVCPKADYIDQMKGYLHLYKKPFGIICYVLTDSDEEAILKEANSQAWILGLGELTRDVYDQVKETMTYSDIDNRLRVRAFRVDADPDFIKEVETRVVMCREYAKEVIAEFKAMIKLQPDLIKDK